jgi:hypothetical protein
MFLHNTTVCLPDHMVLQLIRPNYKYPQTWKHHIISVTFGHIVIFCIFKGDMQYYFMEYFLAIAVLSWITDTRSEKPVILIYIYY